MTKPHSRPHRQTNISDAEQRRRAAFARRALERLPEHLTDRIDDLAVIMELLPPGHATRRTALEMLLHLRMHRRLEEQARQTPPRQP